MDVENCNHGSVAFPAGPGQNVIEIHAVLCGGIECNRFTHNYSNWLGWEFEGPGDGGTPDWFGCLFFLFFTLLGCIHIARSMNGKAGLSFCLRSILQMWTDTIRNFVHRKQLCTNVNSGQVVCLIISKKLVSCERNWVVVSGGEQGMRTRVTFVYSTCLEILKFRSWVNTSIEQYK